MLNQGLGTSNVTISPPPRQLSPAAGVIAEIILHILIRNTWCIRLYEVT